MTDARTGLTPQQWRERMEAAAANPENLKAALAELEQEMRSERSFLHDHPSPDGLLTSLIHFLTNDRDNDYEQLEKKIRFELEREQQVLERYRTWKPGEDPEDRLFLYVKDFGGELAPDSAGVQFPGFLKLKGLYETATIRENYIFYLNKTFPGRDPANFHVVFIKENSNIIIKRVYRMELPRQSGKSSAREVLKEMVQELAPDLSAIAALAVDNAANVETRQALLEKGPPNAEHVYRVREDADPCRTPMGHLMIKLAEEMGLRPGEFKVQTGDFGLLRLELNIERGNL